MITITIDTDNDAFGNGEDPQTDTLTREVLRILNSADFYEGGSLYDINGNSVGEIIIT